MWNSLEAVCKEKLKAAYQANIKSYQKQKLTLIIILRVLLQKDTGLSPINCFLTTGLTQVSQAIAQQRRAER
jgi:hypothetical protein